MMGAYNFSNHTVYCTNPLMYACVFTVAVRGLPKYIIVYQRAGSTVEILEIGNRPNLLQV